MSAPPQHRPVLCIEDSDDDFAILQRLYLSIDTETTLVRFKTGLAFLQAVGEGWEVDPAYVLLDLNLPGMNGLDVLQRMRGHEHWRCVPVIMLSGSSRPAEVRNAHLAGANSYVTKPLDPRPLRDRLETLHHYWRDVVEHPRNHLP